MGNYYLLEVLDGVYFVQFKGNKNLNGNKDSLVYTVDQDEAWKTSNLQAAQNMKISIMRLFNIPSKVIIYDQFPNKDNDQTINF